MKVPNHSTISVTRVETGSHRGLNVLRVRKCVKSVGMCGDGGDAWICVEVVWGCVEMVEMHGYVWRWCGCVEMVDMHGYVWRSGGVGMFIEPLGTPHINQHLSGKLINDKFGTLSLF